MNKNELNKLKEEEIKILLEVERICKKNNIKYFIMYGTLLGAVRHKGFIPWDDDIDICMMRKDYEKFKIIAKNELDSKYFLDYEGNNSKYYLPFIKVRKNNTCVYEKETDNYDGHKGIWIDIFPYEYKKNNKKDFFYKLKFKFLGVLYACLSRKNLNVEANSKINFISKILNNKLIFRLIKILSIHKKEEKYTLNYSPEGIDYTKIIEVKDIFPLQKYKFEKYVFYGPNNYDKILKQIYGNNYMELPPEEKRVNHGISKVIFDNNKKS